MKIFKITMVLFLLAVTVGPAHADIFGDIGKAVTHAANDVRKAGESVASAAKKAAKATAKSAQVISSKAIKDTEKFSKQAEKDIAAAAKTMVNLFNQLGSAAKTCEAFIARAGSKALGAGFKTALGDVSMGRGLDEVSAAAGYVGDNGYPPTKVIEYLGSSQCMNYQVSGFTCGILPYLKGIATAIAQGAGDTKRLAQYTGRAYNSKICSSLIDPLSRGQCALIVGQIQASRESMSCTARVIQYATRGGAGNIGAKLQSKKKQICTLVGETAFGFALDAGIVAASGGAASGVAAAEATAKAIKLAQTVRTALKMESMAEDKVKEICKKGAIQKKTEMAREDHVMEPLKGPNPGEHLTLRAYLGSPKCMEMVQRSHQSDARIWDCSGQPQQRWSFHSVKDALQIWNDHLGGKGCLTAPSETDKNNAAANNILGNSGSFRDKALKTYKDAEAYTTQKCDNNNKGQLFQILDGGQIKNKKTNLCLTLASYLVSPKTNGALVMDRKCNEKLETQTWYYSDPANDLVRPNPGAHLLVHTNPNNPICLDGYINEKKVGTYSCHGKSNQKWSFQGSKNPKAKNYRQIWNDQLGPNGCLTSSGIKGVAYKLKKCSKGGNKFQQFEMLPNGKIRNLKTKMCLANNITGKGPRKLHYVEDWPCGKEDSKAPANWWYVTG